MDTALLRRRRPVSRTPVLDWPYGVNPVFSRTGTAIQTGPDGVVASVATGVRRDDHWMLGSGVWRRTQLREFAATNIAWPCRDLTAANWTPTDVTVLKDQVGVDGVANAACSVEATAGNGTVGHAVTLASSSRIMSMYVKRLVGSGVVEMTTNGGTNWDAVTVTAGWTRVSIPARTVTNPALGIRIVTSGDKIAVDFVQNEVGPVVTSPILTTTAAATRAVEVTTAAIPATIRDMCGMVEFVERGGYAIASGSPRVFNVGTSTTPPRIFLYSSGTGYRLSIGNAAASSDVTSDLGTQVAGDLVRVWWWLEVIGGQMRINGRQAVGAGSFTSLKTTNLVTKDAAAFSAGVYSIGGLDSGAGAGIEAHVRHRIYAGYVPAEAF